MQLLSFGEDEWLRKNQENGIAEWVQLPTLYRESIAKNMLSDPFN